MPATRRVVITGLGAITPLGLNVQQGWDNLIAGKSGISRITRFDVSDFPCQIAGQVPESFNAADYMDAKDVKKGDRFIHLGLAAATEAVNQAGLADMPESVKENIAVVLGSGIGGLPEIEDTHNTVLAKGTRRISPFFIPSILANLLSGQVAIKYGFGGANLCPVTACATGAHAIGQAMRMVQYGECDIALAGGAEASISPLGLGGFAACKALSTGYNATPEQASRPFDEGRDGFVMAEGAGVLVLEEYEHAKKRGAEILAEVLGFAQTGDAYHLTQPAPGGAGAMRAMRKALADAGVNAADVSAINAHATSTPTGDAVEAAAIADIFGKQVSVSSTKGATGHMLGATGAVESIFSILSLKHQLLPATLNLQSPLTDTPLNHVTHQARPSPLKIILKNAFGFGGTNATLVFGRI